MIDSAVEVVLDGGLPSLQHKTTFEICGPCRVQNRDLRPHFGLSWSHSRINHFLPEADKKHKQISALINFSK